MRDRVTGRFAPFTDRDLEEYLAGDLEQPRAQELEAAAAQQPELQAYFDERRAAQRAFLALHPTLRTEAQPAPFWRSWFVPAGVTVAAAATALLYIAIPSTTADPDAADGAPGVVRAKGAPKVELTVQRGERVFGYRQGVLLREGDRVRVTVESAEASWLCLLGQDGTGRFQVYYERIQIDAASYTLPGSLELDAVEGAERWYAVLSDTPVSGALLVAKLHRGESLGPRVTTLEITKETTP